MSQLIVWDVAVAVGVLVQATKLADWILRPKQQEWVRDIFDSITLRLDEAKPLRWFRLIERRSIQYSLVCTSAAAAIKIGLGGYFKGRTGWTWNDLKTCLVLFVPPFFIFYWWGHAIIGRIYGKGQFGPFVIKYVAFVLTSVLAGGLVLLLLYMTALVMPSSWSLGTRIDIAFAIMALLGWVIIVSWIITVSGLFAITAQLILIVLAGLLIPLRAVAWRIVEYNKGPWAAISLLVTVICTAIDLYLRAMART